MIHKIDFNEYNICLLSGNQIVQKSSIGTINNLNSFSVDLNLSNKVAKKFIHSNLIFEICETILNCKTNNKIVIYYNIIDEDFSWFNNFFNSKDLVKFFNYSFKTYKKTLPISIFTGKDTLEYIENDYKLNNEDNHLLLNNITQYTQSKLENTKSFKKTKKFLDEYQLTYLSNNYFNTVKSKQIMYK